MQLSIYVRHFVYTAYLPGEKKTVRIKELQFGRCKHLVKNITNDNDIIIAESLDTLLVDLCPEETNIKQYSFIDKLIILLTVRAICLSPVIELTATCPSTGKQFNSNLQLADVIDKLQKINLPENLYSTEASPGGSLTVMLGAPSTLNISEKDFTIIDTVVRGIILNNVDITKNKNVIMEQLPITIIKDIKEYITRFNNCLKNINLFSVVSPYAVDRDEINIPLNLFSNSVIEFLKICFKRSLMSFYEIEYFLLTELGVDYELIKTSTPAELNIYINMYKDKKSEEDKAERKKNLNLPV
jgi:hypothetical protein